MEERGREGLLANEWQAGQEGDARVGRPSRRRAQQQRASRLATVDLAARRLPPDMALARCSLFSRTLQALLPKSSFSQR